MNRCISVSELSRGMASKVIKDVNENKEQYIVLKNNKPQAIILPVEEYIDLLNIQEGTER